MAGFWIPASPPSASSRPTASNPKPESSVRITCSQNEGKTLNKHSSARLWRAFQDSFLSQIGDWNIPKWPQRCALQLLRASQSTKSVQPKSKTWEKWHFLVSSWKPCSHKSKLSRIFWTSSRHHAIRSIKLPGVIDACKPPHGSRTQKFYRLTHTLASYVTVDKSS